MSRVRIHLTNVVRQPGAGRTFRFFVSAWDPPLEVGQEVIVFLSRDEPDLYDGFGGMTFTSGRLHEWIPRGEIDIPGFESSAPVEEVWKGVQDAFRRRTPAR